MAAESHEPESLRMELQEVRLVDEETWKNNVIDVKRVMNACRALWLVLENESEAMLRVACEILTCHESKHIVFWEDYWWSIEEQRESLRGIVQQKLRRILAGIRGHAGSSALLDSQESQKKDEQLRAELARIKAALAASEEASVKARRTAELDTQALRDKADEAVRKIADLEASCEKLRGELRQLKQGLAADDSARQLEEALSKVSALEQQLQAQSQAGGLQAKRFEKLEQELRDSKTKLAQVESQLATSQDEVKRLEALLSKAESSRSKASPEVRQSALQSASTVDSDELRRAQAQTAELEQRLAAMAQKAADLETVRARASALEAAEAKARAEAASLQAELDELRSKAAELDELRSKKVNPTGVPEHAQKAKVGARESLEPHDRATVEKLSAEVKTLGQQLKEKDVELETLRSQLDKLRAKAERQTRAAEEERGEKERLEDEKMKVLKINQTLRDQVKQLMALAERKGMKKALSELMEGAGLAETMADKDWDIFDKLYDDALRRQDKLRSQNAGKNHGWGATGNAHAKRSMGVSSHNFNLAPLGPTSLKDQLSARPGPAASTWYGGASGNGKLQVPAAETASTWMTHGAGSPGETFATFSSTAWPGMTSRASGTGFFTFGQARAEPSKLTASGAGNLSFGHANSEPSKLTRMAPRGAVHTVSLPQLPNARLLGGENNALRTWNGNEPRSWSQQQVAPGVGLVGKSFLRPFQDDEANMRLRSHNSVY